MNKTTRRRVLAPLLMPLTVLGGILLFALSLSRILLAVETSVSVLVAVLAAAYVMATAFVVERNPDIGARALAAGLVLGMVGLAGAGAVAQSVGIRDIHHEEEIAAGEEGEGPTSDEGGGESAELPPDALVWGADNTLLYTDAPADGPAGDITVAIDNEGSLEHNVTFEGINNDQPVVAAASGIDVAEVTIPPGEYTYYCSVPGHRPAGMEGQITLS